MIYWLEGPLAWIGSKEVQAADEFSQIDIGPKNESAVRLAQKLLSHQGAKIVIPFQDEEISELIFSEGEYEQFIKVDTIPGRTNSCHENCARVWIQDPNLILVTGYGLSNDGYWRRHTWLKEADRIIETTEIRESYFGVSLTRELAQSFSGHMLE